MEKSKVFAFNSYKQFMKSYFRGEGSRGSLSRAAETLGCQRSFLSRIMNSKMQITPDLAFRLCLHWHFSADEREYFLTLVEMERAADLTYREHLKDKIKELKGAHDSLSERAKRPRPTGAHDALYFSSWHWTAIHFLTSIPEFQSADKIAQHLNLSNAYVTNCLEFLKSLGFVTQLGKKWEYKGGEFHLPKDSPLVILHHQNWRHKAVMDAQTHISSDSIHFTNVHTISRANFPLLKERLLEFISDANALLRSSENEDCVVLLCDLFQMR